LFQIKTNLKFYINIVLWQALAINVFYVDFFDSVDSVDSIDSVDFVDSFDCVNSKDLMIKFATKYFKCYKVYLSQNFIIEKMVQ